MHGVTLAGITVLVALVRATGAREVFMGSPSDQCLRRALEIPNGIARNPATVVKAQLNPNFPADLAHGQELALHPLLPQFPCNILLGIIPLPVGVASNLDHNSIRAEDIIYILDLTWILVILHSTYRTVSLFVLFIMSFFSLTLAVPPDIQYPFAIFHLLLVFTPLIIIDSTNLSTCFQTWA